MICFNSLKSFHTKHSKKRENLKRIAWLILIFINLPSSKYLTPINQPRDLEDLGFTLRQTPSTNFDKPIAMSTLPVQTQLILSRTEVCQSSMD